MSGNGPSQLPFKVAGASAIVGGAMVLAQIGSARAENRRRANRNNMAQNASALFIGVVVAFLTLVFFGGGVGM